MAWATLQDARDDLRDLIQDGPTDKLRHRQKCFGIVNGSNNIFKTADRRRVTDFTSPGARLGAFLNNDETVQAVSSDDQEIGEFTLTATPTSGDRVIATYFFQWFDNKQIDKFLTSGGQFVLCTDLILTLGGLQEATLKYAAHDAFTYLASLQENLTATYRVEDRAGNIRNVPLATHYNTMADRMFNQAKTLRKDFYERKDADKAPRSVSLAGRVTSTVPPR